MSYGADEIADLTHADSVICDLEEIIQEGEDINDSLVATINESSKRYRTRIAELEEEIESGCVVNRGDGAVDECFIHKSLAAKDKRIEELEAENMDVQGRDDFRLEQIAALVKAGDAMASVCEYYGEESTEEEYCMTPVKAWDKAKAKGEGE